MANLAIQEILKSGLEPSYAAAAAGGDEFANDDRTFFIIKNGDASQHTVTFTVVRASFDIPGLGEVSFTNLAVAVPASEERVIKVPAGPYNNVNGRAAASYDAVTSVTVAAVRMPPG